MMKLWLVMATTWVWWAAIIGPAAWVCSSSLSVTGGRHNNNLSIDRVEFRVVGCTKKTYSAFMEALRARLSGGTNRENIPLMRAPDPSREDLLFVELFDWDNESITLVLNLNNAYVIAYRAQNRYYLLHDTPANTELYGSNAHRLSFEGSYTALQNTARENREDIDLGITQLAQAILTLYYWSPPTVETSVARSLIILIQMVSESARFRTIEQRVRRNILDELNPTRYDSFRPGAGMIALQTNWESLSSSVQESSNGAFDSPVTLQTTDHDTIDIGNAEDARRICGLVLLLYACKARQSLHALLSPPHDSSVLSTLFLNVRSMLDIADDTCEHPEPTVRISGRDGYCIDVKDGFYNNGNPIILWPCKGNDNLNQFWTFKRDGTIRSNGKCLTAYGYNAGAYVMIYDCSSAVKGATLWTMYLGSLTNQPSGLAIGADSGNSGTVLTMQVHLNASKQGWLPSNDTRSFLTSIIGLNDLCMQRKGQEDVGLAACQDNNSDQKWYFYSDGSIRPLVDPSYCVTCQAHDEGSRIILLSCNFGGASQRWMFTSQGTIYNLYNEFVMDVKGSDPSLQQIIIWSSTGNPNQKWFTTF